MTCVEFTELQKDAITELVNMGIGRAASGLSQMIASEVFLSVPDIEFIQYADIDTRFSQLSDDRSSVVVQYFHGDFSGNALLVFPESSGKALLRKMLKDKVTENDINHLEEEGLTEIGNILLNACFGQLAELLSTQLDSDVPYFKSDNFINILKHCLIKSEEALSQIMLLQVDFSLSTSDKKGFVVFVMDVSSMKVFKQKVEEYLGNLF